MRSLKVFYDRFNEYTLKDIFKLIVNNLYLNEPILVYQQKISTNHIIKSDELKNPFIIEKGHPDVLTKQVSDMRPVPWEFRCNKFDGVTDFFVARNDEGIQHISWIYYYNDRNRLLSLEKDEAEIKFCLTLPALRGQGVYPKVVKSIFRYLAENGYKSVYMCVHPENKASIRGIEKAGFVYVDNLRLRKVLGVQVSPRFKTLKLRNNENS